MKKLVTQKATNQPYEIDLTMLRNSVNIVNNKAHVIDADKKETRKGDSWSVYFIVKKINKRIKHSNDKIVNIKD